MYGDFSRDSSTAIRNRRVFMQQGRVLLDADYNDQVASLLHTLETLTADLIGPHGGPKESFRVYEDCGSLKAKAGHYFVKGLLCETTDEKPTPIETPKEEGYHVVYLEAYERHITSAEDPSWREPALRGAETAARTRVEHLFRAKKLNDKDEFDKFVKLLRYRRYERRPIEPEAPPRSGCSPLGWIAAAVLELVKFKSVPVLISPEERPRREEEFNKAFLAKCAPPRLSGACPLETCYVNADGLQPDVYRGFANRLYRIEIHDADEGKPATFKWSRDNGAVTFEAVKDQSLTAKANESAVLQIHDPLKESGQRLQTGQWVELFDRAARRGAGQLMRVQSVRPPDQQGNPELTLE